MEAKRKRRGSWPLTEESLRLDLGKSQWSRNTYSDLSVREGKQKDVMQGAETSVQCAGWLAGGFIKTCNYF